MKTPIECQNCGRFYRADKLATCPGCAAQNREIQESSNQSYTPNSNPVSSDLTAKSPQQPTYLQMQTLIDEIKEIKKLISGLRWFMYSMFISLIFFLVVAGVKVNLSPTLFTPFTE